MSDIIDEALLERGIKTRPADFDYKKCGKEDRWLTKEEAITWLNVWREIAIPKYNLYFPSNFQSHHITSGIKHVYMNYLVDELIQRIRKSDHDPITVVAEYNYYMDNILAMSDMDHCITHKFAGFMERESYEILLYLKEKEKELNNK